MVSNIVQDILDEVYICQKFSDSWQARGQTNASDQKKYASMT